MKELIKIALKRVMGADYTREPGFVNPRFLALPVLGRRPDEMRHIAT
ncbi:MAG: hypothetical protein MJE77_37290 [Proteobacteria bacterium]|nr:hypothetical protein [Pseudomonadota bacterium]